MKPEDILAKVFFHDIPEENDYDVHDEKHMSGDCDGCVPAYIVTRSSFDTLKEDRDHQYEMKVKARDQRDAVTAKLKKAQAENLRLIRNFINPNSTVLATHCVPEDFQGD